MLNTLHKQYNTQMSLVNYIAKAPKSDDCKLLSNLVFSRVDVSSGILSVSLGGTGVSSLSSGYFLVGAGTSAVTTTKAVPSGVVVGTTDLQALSNKTLTSPVVNEILDASANKLVSFTATATAVNYLQVTNNVSGSNPILSAAGTDTNLGISLASKGTGSIDILGTATSTSETRFYNVNSANYIGIKAPGTIASNKTFTSPNADGTASQSLVTNGSGTLSFATKSNILTYSICNTATTVSDVATVLATSNWIWKQSKYGAAGTIPVTSGTLTYMYTSDAGGVGKTLTVSVYNTTTALVLSTDAFVIPAITAGVARAFAFTLPTADAQLQLQVSRTTGAGTVINVIGGHLELVMT